MMRIPARRSFLSLSFMPPWIQQKSSGKVVMEMKARMTIQAGRPMLALARTAREALVVTTRAGKVGPGMALERPAHGRQDGAGK